MQKLISVIIPTYNRAHSVVDAIRSVKSQTYPAIQLIVVNDGSSDNTAEIVKQFDGIEYYYQENGGQAAARNLGLKYAKGEYIASLDSDDMWQRNFLTDAVKCIEKHDLDFVFLNWTSQDGKENFIDFWERKKKWKKYISENDAEWFLLDSQQLRNLFLEACPSPSSSLLIRRESMASKWNENMIIADDWYLMLETVLSKPCRAAFTLSPYWTKRVFGDNVYDGRSIMDIIHKGILDDRIMKENLEARLTAGEKYILRRRIALTHLNFGRLTWKNERISKNVVSSVFKAFSLAPASIGFHFLEMFVNHLQNRFRPLSTDDKKLKSPAKKNDV